MNPPWEQDHYELLEIPRPATAEQVEKAYRMVRSIYTEDSMAGYAVFEDGDVEEIRERIEVAYRTLADEQQREAYDALLDERLARDASREVPGADVAAIEVLDELDETGGDFDGARLRRVRLHRGVEIEEIAEVTKVNPTYLHFLEEERFEDLPSAVYVRGFVKGFASCVGLPPDRVARSYMQRYEETRDNPKRRRFGRR